MTLLLTVSYVSVVYCVSGACVCVCEKETRVESRIGESGIFHRGGQDTTERVPTSDDESIHYQQLDDTASSASALPLGLQSVVSALGTAFVLQHSTKTKRATQ